MSWTVGAATAGFRLALVVLAGLAASLTPSLLATQANGPSAAVLATLALAVAAVLMGDRHVAGFLPGPVVSRAGTTEGLLSSRTGGVTDPVHHPLRPRAPGLV